jgi:biotin carboxyl carrier protein
MSTTVRVKVNGRWYSVEIDDLGANPVQARVDGEVVEVDVGELPVQSSRADGPAGPAPPVAEAPPPRAAQPPAPQTSAPKPTPAAPTSGRVFSSPMPGIIISVAVEVGTNVVTGDDVCILEAMKMQQTLRADWSGVVSAVHVQPGQQVSEGDPIVELA